MRVVAGHARRWDPRRLLADPLSYAGQNPKDMACILFVLAVGLAVGARLYSMVAIILRCDPRVLFIKESSKQNDEAVQRLGSTMGSSASSGAGRLDLRCAL
jgi:hypothetical protein